MQDLDLRPGAKVEYHSIFARRVSGHHSQAPLPAM
jgi:hypothetical protein